MSVAERIALDLINKVIADRGIKPGEKLPSERELATLCGLSRTTIRRALNSLMVSGEVIREIGSGTYLTDAAPSAVHESQYHTLGMFDVSALRAMLEPNIVALAAVTADKTDIDEILRCLQGQEYATNYEEFEKWDVALHRSFVKATHNRLLLEVYVVIEKARDDPSWKSYKSRTFTSNLEMYQAQHKEIVSFLVDRDAVAAGSAMRRHISAISRALVSETPQSAQNLVLPVLNNLQIVE